MHLSLGRRRTQLLRGNGRRTNYEYDPVSRLSALVNTSFGSSSDVRFDYTYSPAGQIVSTTRSNDAYAWTGHGSDSTDYAADGLNRLCAIGSSTCSGGAATTHDARGNLTHDPTTGKTYSYLPSTNQLWTVSSPWASFGYDALGRLAVIDTSADVKLAYDGIDAIAEYDGAGALQRRFVHGPGIDEPLVQYEGTGTSSRRFLEADERGSVILVTDSAGATLTTNKYDEFGKPQSTNSGRFQYTGQMWLPEAGLYHYKARVYAPHLGRFLQTDPIGYEDSPNLYAYVGNDPVNFSDPLGLQDEPVEGDTNGDGKVDGDDDIIVTGDPCSIFGRCLTGDIYISAGYPSFQPINFGVGLASEKQDQCPAVPSPGPGQSVLDKNIRDALLDAKINSMDPFSGDLFGVNFSNVSNFIAKVAPFGPQDYKNIIPGSEEFGNFNYGAVGGAYGFSLQTLLGRAANVQTFSNLLQGKGLSFSDNPNDPKPISLGHKYFKLGCHK